MAANIEDLGLTGVFSDCISDEINKRSKVWREFATVLGNLLEVIRSKRQPTKCADTISDKDFLLLENVGTLMATFKAEEFMPLLGEDQRPIWETFCTGFAETLVQPLRRVLTVHVGSWRVFLCRCAELIKSGIALNANDEATSEAIVRLVDADVIGNEVVQCVTDDLEVYRLRFREFFGNTFTVRP